MLFLTRFSQFCGCLIEFNAVWIDRWLSFVTQWHQQVSKHLIKTLVSLLIMLKQHWDIRMIFHEIKYFPISCNCLFHFRSCWLNSCFHIPSDKLLRSKMKISIWFDFEVIYIFTKCLFLYICKYICYFFKTREQLRLSQLNCLSKSSHY